LRSSTTQRLPSGAQDRISVVALVRLASWNRR
jgi:hypothetical protein